MEMFLTFLRLGLFAVLGIAAVGKILDLKESQKAVESYGISGESAKFIGSALPVAELLIAFGFLFYNFSRISASLASLLFLVFAFAVARKYFAGSKEDCHCFGQIHSAPISGFTVVRNVVFLLASLILLGAWREQGMNFVTRGFEFFVVIALGAIFLFAVAIYSKFSNVLALQNETNRRIEAMSLLSEDRKEQTSEAVNELSEGLPVGSILPDFIAKDIHGTSFGRSDLETSGKAKLLLFVSSTCSPCASIIPKIDDWAARLGGAEVILFSSGSADDNKTKFGATGRRIVLQENQEIAELFFAKWTPTAVLISADGRIAAKPAIGDDAIEAVIAAAESNALNSTNVRHEKIGLELPQILLPNASSSENAAEHDASGKQMFVFWSITCPFCKEMLPDILQYENNRTGNDVPITFFCDTDAETANQIGTKFPVLLDAKSEFGNSIGSAGTPSGYIVENGKVVSDLAVGASEIWRLLGWHQKIEKLKAEESK